MGAKQIAIYGAGGSARETAWLIQSCNVTAEKYRVVSFIDDNEANHGKVINEIPVIGLEEAKSRFADAFVVGAVGSPKLRETLMQQAADAGFNFETIIHPRVEQSKWIEIGVGSVICAGTILTTNIRLGEHIQINIDCTISHDVVMGDFTTLAPGVHVCGCVRLGRRVYIGTGAAIINGRPDVPLTIGDDAVIGAGACVTGPIAARVTAVGVPAKPLARN
jgi:sugar O-acyltransferase (sialic acid O-acetyltransferase NeuD family)